MIIFDDVVILKMKKYILKQKDRLLPYVVIIIIYIACGFRRDVLCHAVYVKDRQVSFSNYSLPPLTRPGKNSVELADVAIVGKKLKLVSLIQLWLKDSFSFVI